MRHTFIKKENSSGSLLLFFGGWGSEPDMFASCTPEHGTDMLLCWDYSDMELDTSVLEGYACIKVMAWSMGVWAAGHVLSRCSLPVVKKVAICGTPFPIDDRKGIPVQIFKGTLDNISERTVEKFRRRMCGSAETLAELKRKGLSRSTESLASELAAIWDNVHKDSEAGLIPASLKWDLAITGSRDMIFPVENQKYAWASLNVPATGYDMAHYDAGVLESLPGTEEIWTKI